MDFIIYAATFRIAVIAAGTVFMYLGYRLLVLGVMPPEGTAIEGGVGGVRLTVKNAAPGTLFCLFGSILIGMMLFNGNPELRVLESAGTKEVTIRGTAPDSPGSTPAAIDLGAIRTSDRPSADLIGEYAAALSDPAQTLGASRAPLLGLSAVYHRDKRFDEAVALVRLVYGFTGDDFQTLGLMARIEAARGDTGTAQKVLSRMEKTFPDRQDEIADLRQEVIDG